MGKPKDLSNTCILVTEAAKCPPENRKRMADILFNNFGFKAILFETQALLSLMAEGHHTGCVLDSGDGVTHVIPVVDGQVLQHNIEKLQLAGRTVTHRLV